MENQVIMKGDDQQLKQFMPTLTYIAESPQTVVKSPENLLKGEIPPKNYRPIVTTLLVSDRVLHWRSRCSDRSNGSELIIILILPYFFMNESYCSINAPSCVYYWIF